MRRREKEMWKGFDAAHSFSRFTYISTVREYCSKSAMSTYLAAFMGAKLFSEDDFRGKSRRKQQYCKLTLQRMRLHNCK